MSGKAKLSHFSVKEYLLSSRLLRSIPSFHITETTSHSHISKTCLAYLAQFDESLKENFLQAWPLSSYAARHWIFHAQSGDIESTSDLQKLATHFLLHDHMRANWTLIWDIDQTWFITRAIRSVASPLYYASMGGLGVVVRMLIESGVDVNAQGGVYGNALQAASHKGSEAIVKMLIESGADVNAQGGDTVMRSRQRRVKDLKPSSSAH